MTLNKILRNLFIISLWILLYGCTYKNYSGLEKEFPKRKLDEMIKNAKFVVGDKYKMKGKTYRPAVNVNFVEVGEASFYSTKFHGKKTASGSKFNKNSYTAAHRELPLLSVVRVTNMANNKTVVVVVNDRGPFAKTKTRIIDVSENVAKKLGFYKKGVANVKVEYMHEYTEQLIQKLPKKEQEKALIAFANALEKDNEKKAQVLKAGAKKPLRKKQLKASKKHRSKGVPAQSPAQS